MGDLPTTPAGPISLVNPTARVEPCACGGEIVATHPSDLGILSAVMRHRDTPGHVAWTESEGLAAPLPGDWDGPLDRELARELGRGSPNWRQQRWAAR